MILSRLTRALAELARDVIHRLRGIPAVGKVDFGDLRRLSPLSSRYGWDRGLPIDRFYIGRFLEHHSRSIRGDVLEMYPSLYAIKYGRERVSGLHVLSVDSADKDATLIADLSACDELPDAQFDTIILTQTLHVIYDVHAAMANIYRLLKPGGCLLVTVPGISPVAAAAEPDIWYWVFTYHALRRLLGDVFGSENISLRTYGNVFSAVAFLEGLATSELHEADLDVVDSCYPVIVAASAVRRALGP